MAFCVMYLVVVLAAMCVGCVASIKDYVSSGKAAHATANTILLFMFIGGLLCSINLYRGTRQAQQQQVEAKP